MNNSQSILNKFTSKKGQVAILIDPEKCDNGPKLLELIKKAEFAAINYFFIGGSTVTKTEFDLTINFLKLNTGIPLVIFPGSSHQVSEKADALLYLSLLSGRNPDYLIGHHVQSASEIYKLDFEVISTGYILVDGGTRSTVSYISQTTPIPSDQISIVRNTAIAGVLQGKKMLYFDAGSGAKYPISAEIIKEVVSFGVPIIVGGGIRTLEKMEELKKGGVNVIVIGNHIEENIDFLLDIKSFTCGNFDYDK